MRVTFAISLKMAPRRKPAHNMNNFDKPGWISKWSFFNPFNVAAINFSGFMNILLSMSLNEFVVQRCFCGGCN